MIEFKNIVFPTDFSAYSDNALHYAVALSKLVNGTVHCCHVVDQSAIQGGGAESVYGMQSEDTSYIESVETHAKEEINKVATVIRAKGGKADTHTMVGNPAKDVVKYAAEVNADLVVMATHGRTGFDHFLFGSTCEKVLRQSSVPVLAIKQDEHEFVNPEDESIAIEKVLCPIDLTGFSRQVLPYAAEICRQFGATLILVHVVDQWLDYTDFVTDSEMEIRKSRIDHAEGELKKLADNLLPLTVETRVVTGVPHRELASIAKKENVDLITLTTHGRTRFVHAVLGSVAEKVLRLAPCPVLTVPPLKEQLKVTM